MQDLPVALAEGPADVPRDALDDDGLLILVIADLDAEAAQLVGQHRLEVGAELLDPVVRERPKVERPDPAVRGCDDVHQEVVDVRVWVTGDRGVEQVSLPLRPILDLQGGPGCVVPEGDPPDRTWIGAVLATFSAARPADFVRDVAHGAIGSAVDGVPDQRRLCGRWGELGCEGDGLVRAEHQVHPR